MIMILINGVDIKIINLNIIFLKGCAGGEIIKHINIVKL